MGLILKNQTFGGCHGNMPTVGLLSIRILSKNQDLLSNALNFKNIEVLQNPVRGSVFIIGPWTTWFEI